MLAALFNGTAQTHEGVYLRIAMDYADARRDHSHQDILPLYLDVLPPGGRMYNVPPGTSKRSWDWSPAISGRVLALGGHLHKYGQKLVLEDVTTGDTLWTGSGSYDEEGELTGVSRKIYLRGQRLEREHVYRLTCSVRQPDWCGRARRDGQDRRCVPAGSITAHSGGSYRRGLSARLASNGTAQS